MRLHTPLHILLEEMSPGSIRTAEQSLYRELFPNVSASSYCGAVYKDAFSEANAYVNLPRKSRYAIYNICKMNIAATRRGQGLRV